MDDKERRELIDKIMSVDSDAKVARVASTVFMNKGTKEEAKYFLDYLDHYNPNIRRLARSIVGQMGLTEACEILINEFNDAVGSLTFMPDVELKESDYYPNLIEILETVFSILKAEGCKNDEFLKSIEMIFKRTKNEDLRFTLIKLLALLGDQIDYFLNIYEELTEKERRALYYVYTYVEDPRSLEIYRKGFGDDKNFDYVIANLLNFQNGKKMLSDELLTLSNYNKQVVLKKLRDGEHPEFNDVLIKLLNDKNKFLVEIAIEILKNNIKDEPESLQPFISTIETGYSPEGIAGSLEIVAHCVKHSPEDIYLSGLEQQPSPKNKNIILDFFIEQLKENLKPTDELTEKVLPKLLVYFDNYSKDREELILSIFKIITSLRFPVASRLRSLKKTIIKFKQEFDKRFTTQFRNNMGEFLVKLNQMIARFEETENKLKNVTVLFDIDHQRIDHDRMLKLKDQLAEIELNDDEIRARLVEFLVDMYKLSKIDWKIKSVSVELLGDYGGPNELPLLIEASEKESSLAVKVNAQKAVKNIEERNAAAIQYVLIVEPLPFLQKKLSDFFKSQAFKVALLTDVSRFDEVANAPFRYLVISESLLTDDQLTPKVFDYLDEHFDTALIIVTAKPEEMAAFEDIPNVKFLKKPFNDETLKEVITENHN
jgi:HEAT repeat protein